MQQEWEEEGRVRYYGHHRQDLVTDYVQDRKEKKINCTLFLSWRRQKVTALSLKLEIEARRTEARVLVVLFWGLGQECVYREEGKEELMIVVTGNIN